MPDLTNLFNLLEENGAAVGLSKATGISSGNICDWKSGRSKPNAETLVKVANYFDCSVDYLLGRTNIKKVNSEPITIYRFPVFYQSAAAGVGRLDVSNGYYMENFTVNNLPNEAVFIMEIAGESMYDEKSNYLIHTRSKVLIDTKIENYELNRRIVIVNFSGKTICKRYVKENNYILYKSDNEFFEKENRKSTDDPNHKIIGVVLGVIEDNKFIEIE